MPAERFSALLAGPDPAARRRAIKGLRRLGTPEAADALARALTDEDAEIRQLAADALISFGPDACETVVARLREAGGTPDCVAIRLLGRLYNPVAIALLSRLVAAREPETRAAVAAACGELAKGGLRSAGNDPAGQTADPGGTALAIADEEPGSSRVYRNPAAAEVIFETLVELLRDLDAKVRIAAAMGLGALGDERAIDPLLDELNDDAPASRAAAVAALGQIGSRRASEELARLSGADPHSDVRQAATDVLRGVTGRSVEPFIRMLANEDPARRIEAMTGLLEMGRAAVLALSDLLQNGAPEARVVATELLGRIGEPVAVEPLASACADDDARVRVAGATALGRILTPRSAELLAPLLDADDPALSAAAADGLERLGPAAIEPVMNQLGSRREVTRIRAIDVLGRLRHKGACERLVAGLGASTAWVRAVSAQALGEIGEHRAAGELIVRLSDRDTLVRAMAAEALGKLAERDALQPLVARLEDPSDLVRAEALRALGRIGNTEALPGIVAALENAEPDIQIAAIESLVALRAGEPPEQLRRLARPWPRGRARADVRRVARWGLSILAPLAERDRG